MRVLLEIELDIPGAEKLSDDELRQVIFDEYINHATVSHLDAALDWLGSKKQTLLKSVDTGFVETAEEKAQSDEIRANIERQSKIVSARHQAWADICEKAAWSVKVI